MHNTTFRIEFGFDCQTRLLLTALFGGGLSDEDKAALKAATDERNAQTAAVQAALDNAPKQP